ncbi:hypothetical protein ACHAWC_002500, partial [Mediolabrus comicus]
MITTFGLFIILMISTIKARYYLELYSHPLGLLRFLPRSVRGVLVERSLHDCLICPSESFGSLKSLGKSSSKNSLCSLLSKSSKNSLSSYNNNKMKNSSSSISSMNHKPPSRNNSLLTENNINNNNIINRSSSNEFSSGG